jgi:RNA ligase-like protein
MTPELHKYPRTHHLEGSRLQPGDQDLDAVPLATLRGRFVVVEEKVDGANAGISAGGGTLRLQSRGHFLTGGARERHFDLFKRWAGAHRAAFVERLGERYVCYGEWLYAKHTVFYDRLPGYFLEFDVLDRETGRFLSTEARRALLAGLPLVSVPVLWQGIAARPSDIPDMVTRSLYKSERWREGLVEAIRAEGLDPERLRGETDPADEAEGLYVKVEEGGCVVARYKYIRASFLTAVIDSGSHWLSRPIVPNQLADGVDLWAP